MESSRFQFLLEQFKRQHLSLSEHKELLDFASNCDDNKWQMLLEGMIENDENKIILPQAFLANQLKDVLETDKQLKIIPVSAYAHRIHFYYVADF